jgi:hypothetical protein
MTARKTWASSTRLPRVRFTIRRLMLVIAVAAVASSVLVWARRPTPQPKPPLPWPWEPAFYPVNHMAVLYVNGEDLRLGVYPPRVKFVQYDGTGGRFRILDAPDYVVPFGIRRQRDQTEPQPPAQPEES